MKSDKAKVLHEINGTPMVNYVVKAAGKIVGENVYVVVGHQAEEVKKQVLQSHEARFPVQTEQLGTGHAVMCAMNEISMSTKYIVILCGDVPLITPETISKLIEQHISSKATVTVLAVKIGNPHGYGRIVTGKDGKVCRIVEQADADENEQQIDIVNSGIYCVNTDFLKYALKKLKNNNSQSEYYLTDIIEVAYNDSLNIGLAMGGSPEEVMGVNTIDQLQAAVNILNSK
jgi:UDP-N-acetylglucosamine diphosphorylase/glucosamine-1-phosphate N-acetyltransferase